MKHTKLAGWIVPATVALLLICAAGINHATAQTITGTNQVAFSDFDNTVPSWSYGYFYSWGWPDPPPPEPGTTTVDRFFYDPIIDPTNGPMAMRFQFDNTAYQELVATNSGAAYGTGFGMPLNWENDPAVFNSISLADYILSWDARVESLAEGQTTANCEMQIRLISTTRILQKNISYNPGSNWTHFVFTLEDGSYGGDGGTPEKPTSYTTFTNGIATGITGIEFNQNQHMPGDQFGFDGDNAVVMDNIKLEVLQYSGPPPPPPPLVPVAILDVNLDDKPGWGYFGGYNWSQNSYLPTFTYSSAAAGYGVGGSNAWILSMDNSALAPPNTPNWAGGGTGGGGPVNLGLFDTNNLKLYKVTFDSRVEGLAPDITATTCRLQLFLDSSVANGNMRLDFDVPAQSNWVTTAYTFNDAAFATDFAPKASFATNYNTITGLRTQWQIENANSADWGYDADNVLIIDNIKLERLYVACPPLSIYTNGNNVMVSWSTTATGTVKLQGAAKPQGPYSDIAGATSPYPVPLAEAPRFFRTAWVPPGP